MVRPPSGTRGQRKLYNQQGGSVFTLSTTPRPRSQPPSGTLSCCQGRVETKISGLINAEISQKTEVLESKNMQVNLRLTGEEKKKIF